MIHEKVSKHGESPTTCQRVTPHHLTDVPVLVMSKGNARARTMQQDEVSWETIQVRDTEYTANGKCIYNG